MDLVIVSHFFFFYFYFYFLNKKMVTPKSKNLQKTQITEDFIISHYMEEE